MSRVFSAITHADTRCQWGCVILNATIAGFLTDVDSPLERVLEIAENAPTELQSACETVLAVQRGERLQDNLDLENSGYVVTTLQAGLYHGLTGQTAEDAIINAVMMGGDTDTIAAVSGAIAGARFGPRALPERLLQEINEAVELTELAEQLTTTDVLLPESVATRVADETFDL